MAFCTYLKPITKHTVSTFARHVKKLANGVLQATTSDSELRLLCDQLRCNGRILKGEGRFDEARRCFEGCLATPGLSRPKRVLIISHLSDIYCELDYMQRNVCQLTLQPTHLNKGKEIVQREIDRIRANANPSKGLRRLLLSLVEIEIRQGHLERAECIISEHLGIYSRVAEPDVNERVGHVSLGHASRRWMKQKGTGMLPYFRTELTTLWKRRFSPAV